ncbi:MAG: DNA polymerase subunit beta [Thermomicrobiales bacterium]
MREAIAAYLEAVDAAASGLIEGFYLVGSITLADFRPHESDIDFVAVTAARLGAAVCDALSKVHADLQAHYRRPAVEGVYVAWADLRQDSALAAPAHSWHAGRFQTDAFALDPITWHTLARHGVAVRGPAPAALNVHIDPAGLAAWTLHNLDVYWRPWHDRSARLFSGAGLAALGAWASAWGVLGVTRLHYTLATGEIISKAGALVITAAQQLDVGAADKRTSPSGPYAAEA